MHAKLAFSFINMIVVLFAVPLVAFRPSTELAFGAGISVFLIFRSYFEYDNVFILIIVISTISQLGDLFISFLKRKASIKDTGKFLPGHGGILDRIDGIIFAIPVGLLIMKLLFNENIIIEILLHL